MKITVKTTGPFLVHDVFGGQTVSPGEEKPVHPTEYIKHALRDGRLEEVGGEKTAKEEAAPAPAPAKEEAAPAKPAADKGKSNGPTSGSAAKK